MHHVYDPIGQVLYQGDGSRRSAKAQGDMVITNIAGDGSVGFTGDGGPALQARLNSPSGVAVAADGSLFIADAGNNRIRRVGPDGIITTIAGTGHAGFSGDGGLAVQAGFNNPGGVAVAHDGSLIIADGDNNRIRRVGQDGIITTIAGNDVRGFSGDGGPATQASLLFPSDVAVAADGSILIADLSNFRIRRIGLDGIITTVAGGGQSVFSGDGGPATNAMLLAPRNIAATADGSVFIASAMSF